VLEASHQNFLILLTMVETLLDTAAIHSLIPYIANFRIHNMNKAELESSQVTESDSLTTS
jgi:hypothetical protein